MITLYKLNIRVETKTELLMIAIVTDQQTLALWEVDLNPKSPLNIVIIAPAIKLVFITLINARLCSNSLLTMVLLVVHAFNVSSMPQKKNAK